MEDKPEPSVTINTPSSQETAEVQSQAWNDPKLNIQFNQQINHFSDFLGFKEIEELSPEVREVALEYLQKEQLARHQWVSKEQDHAHEIQKKGQDHAMKLNAWGQLLGVFCLLSILAFSGWMIWIGQSAIGIAALLAEVAVVIGAILIVGKKNNAGEEAIKKDS